MTLLLRLIQSGHFSFLMSKMWTWSCRKNISLVQFLWNFILGPWYLKTSPGNWHKCQILQCHAILQGMPYSGNKYKYLQCLLMYMFCYCWRIFTLLPKNYFTSSHLAQSELLLFCQQEKLLNFGWTNCPQPSDRHVYWTSKCLSCLLYAGLIECLVSQNLCEVKLLVKYRGKLRLCLKYLIHC